MYFNHTKRLKKLNSRNDLNSKLIVERLVVSIVTRFDLVLAVFLQPVNPTIEAAIRQVMVDGRLEKTGQFSQVF